MRTIIAGSRSVIYEEALWWALDHCGWEPTVVLCGGARGADELGRLWAKEVGIPVEMYLPQWDEYGKLAGFYRNAEMANKAEALIALWDGVSKGTANMIDNAKRKNLKTYIQIT